MAIAGDGTIYAGVHEGRTTTTKEPLGGHVHAVRPDGVLRWKYDAGATGVGPPVIGRDATHYFGLEDGCLCALGGAETAVEQTSRSRPTTDYALSQNVPNPFNSITTIALSMPEAGEVQLAVYNLSGQRIATLVRGTLAPGTYTITWDGRDDAGGGASQVAPTCTVYGVAGRLRRGSCRGDPDQIDPPHRRAR